MPRPLAALLAVAVVAMAPPAWATDWQPYHIDPEGHAGAIDADSVRADGPLLRFRYGALWSPDAGSFVWPIEGVVDCDGRRYADYLGGKFVLRPVYEKTDSALRLDAACRIAGRAAHAHGAATQPAIRDWRPYVSTGRWRGALDANSVQVHDGHVFFSYKAGNQDILDAVVDCDAREHAEVIAGKFEWRAIVEDTGNARQTDLACELAGQPTAPRVAVDPADWQVYDTGPIGVMQVDAHSVSTQDGLVRFTYRTHFTDGTRIAESEYPRDAVADCARRRRADVVFDKFDLRPVEDGTPPARQLDLACRLAASPPTPQR
jgi:hypothetical protein